LHGWYAFFDDARRTVDKASLSQRPDVRNEADRRYRFQTRRIDLPNRLVEEGAHHRPRALVFKRLAMTAAGDFGQLAVFQRARDQWSIRPQRREVEFTREE